MIRRTLHSKLVPSHQRMQFAPPNYAIGSVRQGLHGKGEQRAVLELVLLEAKCGCIFPTIGFDERVLA